MNKITKIARVILYVSLGIGTGHILWGADENQLRINYPDKTTESVENKNDQTSEKPKKRKKTSKIKKEEDKNEKRSIFKGAEKKILARVTVYWANGAGTDPWSSKNISSTGTKLKCGEHAAVDPKIIPYGSQLKVGTGKKKVVVKAVDTGGAVKTRKAAIAMGKTPAQKKAPVVDLFFQDRTSALAYASKNPPFQWVEIETPRL
jgi:3D (Asp-Asp-Asp) domain-containing protein